MCCYLYWKMLHRFLWIGQQQWMQLTLATNKGNLIFQMVFFFLFKNKAFFFWITVNSVRSTENDCGSCCVFGHSAKLETTAKRPTFSKRNLICSPLFNIRQKLRLNFQNELSLNEMSNDINYLLFLIVKWSTYLPAWLAGGTETDNIACSW